MQAHNWDLFLNQIVIDTVKSETKGKLYRDLGIDWKDWPNCDAKALMRSYSELAARNPDRARFRLASKIEGLKGLLLPQEFTVLAGLYNEMVTVGNVTQFAEALLKNPLEHRKLQNEFNSKTVEEVEDFTMQNVIESVLADQIEKAKEGRAIVSIPGWKLLSEMIGGFNPGRITILAAGTGVGKTNMALNLALSAIQKFRVLYFNMEMTKEDIVGRCIRRGAKISPSAWHAGKIDREKVGEWFIDTLNLQELKITSGKALSLNQIVGKIYTECAEDPLGLVVVDYDQKITSSYQSEEWQNLRRITEDLEECAKAANTHILLLAQGNEEGLPKSSKRMMQSASTVLSFYQDEDRYFIKATKNRHGRYGDTLPLEYDPATSFITENVDPKKFQTTKRVLV